jgi:hypothetical protein
MTFDPLPVLDSFEEPDEAADKRRRKGEQPDDGLASLVNP